jgi:hypothetical protein
MAGVATIHGQAGSDWAVVLPEGVTLSQQGVTNDEFRLDASGGPALNFNVVYDLEGLVDPDSYHGLLSLQVFDLDGGGENDNEGNGLRGSIVINLTNDTDVPLGFAGADETLYVILDDDQSDQLNQPTHPVYVHFHGVPATSGVGGTLTVEGRALASDTPGTAGAPSTLKIGGVIAPHSTQSIAIAVLHERDQQGIDDSFVMTFFPSTDFISAADYATLEAQWAAMNAPPPVTPTGEVDWNLLAQRVTDHFNNTGSWGLLEDWLTPPPPDGGDTAYLL